jgi:putative ABC transport system permease protein
VIYGTDLRTLAKARKDIYADNILAAGLLSTFAVLVCLITAFGMVGLTSFWITQRTRQIGIRRSLGATQSDIKRYFRHENLLLTVVGCILGVALSYLLNYVLARELDAQPLPALWVLGGVVFLIAMGQIAVARLASKAAQIAPALATRTL